MRRHIMALIVFVSLLGSVKAQVDPYCFHCQPREPITVSNLSDLRFQGAREGITLDISFGSLTNRIAVIFQGSPTSPRYFDVYEPIERDEFSLWGRVHTRSANTFMENTPSQIALHPEGVLVAIGDESGNLLFWDIKDERVIHQSQGYGDFSQLIYHPDGMRVIVLESQQYITVYSLETARRQVISQSNLFTAVNNITLSPDGEWLAVATEQGVALYAVNDWLLTAWKGTDEPVSTILFSPNDPQSLYVLGSEIQVWSWDHSSGDIQILSTFTSIPPAPEEDNYKLTTGAISPDSTVLVTSDSRNCMRFWNLIQTLEVHIPIMDTETCGMHRIHEIAFSPDGYFLVWGSIGFHSAIIPDV